ncbi:AMY1.1 [Linum perenne]
MTCTCLFYRVGFNWQSSSKSGWWYNSLHNAISDLSTAGVTHVWLPPPSQSASLQGGHPTNKNHQSSRRRQVKKSYWYLGRGWYCLREGPLFAYGSVG